MKGVRHPGCREALITMDGAKEVIPVYLHLPEGKELAESTDRVDFTPNMSGLLDPSDWSSYGGQKQLLVTIQNFLALHGGKDDDTDDKKKEAKFRQIIASQLSHFYAVTAAWVCGVLIKCGTIERSFYDIRPAKTPLQHSFQLPDGEQIDFHWQGLPPQHNQAVGEEIYEMRKAAIIIQAHLSSSSLVVISKKNDEKP